MIPRLPLRSSRAHRPSGSILSTSAPDPTSPGRGSGSRLLAAALVFFGLGGGAGRSSGADAPSRPNFVIILTDDLDMTQVAYMPQVLGLLGRKGMTFAANFAPDPICAPSRASLLTGLYPHNHKVRENVAPLGGFKAFEKGGFEASNLAVWLSGAGYRTGLIGKYLNGYPTPRLATHVPPGWTDWFGLTSPEYFDYTVNENGAIRTYGHAPEDYQTDVLKARALRFLGVQDPRPFFLYVAPHAPHSPPVPAPRDSEALNGIHPPRPPSYDEADVRLKPKYIRDLPRLSKAVAARTDDLYLSRAETLLAVDALVAEVVKALEAQGALGRTYILFSSDNGFEFGAHRVDHGKGDPYEGSIRVPLLVRGPGISEGTTSESLVANIDLAPTLLDFAGVAAPAPVDGRSLRPILEGRTPEDWRTAVLLEAFDAPDGDVPGYQGLRTRKNLYVQYVTGERELYDLAKDPDELRNLAPESPGLVAELRDRLQTLASCGGASCGK